MSAIVDPLRRGKCLYWVIYLTGNPQHQSSESECGIPKERGTGEVKWEKYHVPKKVLSKFVSVRCFFVGRGIRT